ncbi:hypothetical protein GCM10027190_43900 [Spirosoma areae]
MKLLSVPVSYNSSFNHFASSSRREAIIKLARLKIDVILQTNDIGFNQLLWHKGHFVLYATTIAILEIDYLIIIWYTLS